jgi:hypothetical protein
MTQRGQNSNCFCSNAAMRRQQGLTISFDTFLLGPLTISPILDHTTLRPHGRAIVLAFDETERAPAEPLFETRFGRKSNPFQKRLGKSPQAPNK